MPIHVTDENELHALGFRVDPTDRGRAVPLAGPAAPDDGWETDALGRYAAAELAESTRLDGEARDLVRRSAVHLFRAGRALHLARERLKAAGEWCGWQTRHGIARTSAWEAIELYERAGNEEAVAGLAISEAKTQFGVTRGRTEAATADAAGEAAGGADTAPVSADPCGAGSVAAGRPYPPRRSGAATHTPARPRGAQAPADGLLEVLPDGTARVTTSAFRQLPAGSRPLRVYRGWGSGPREAVARGIPCLLFPDADGPDEPSPTGSALGAFSRGANADGGDADRRVLEQLVALWRDASPTAQLAFLDRPAVRAALDRIGTAEGDA